MPRDDSLLYDLLRKGTQLPALGLDVLCGKDGTYQRHAIHASALELQDVLLVDAADGHHRHVHGVADVQQCLPGHLAYVRLGVGGKYRANAKVVRAVRHSVQRFLYRVGRYADHHALAHALAHLCGGHIVLPHMDALGVALQGHLHVIVDEQRHTVLLAQGVDADVADKVTEENLDSAVAFAKAFAARTGAVIAITGAIDIVADAQKAYCIRNGNAMMSSITGTGCQLSALTAAFVTANPDHPLEAAAAAVCAMGLAGEVAHQRLTPQDGNATYRNYIIDAIYNMTPEQLEKGANYEVR